MLQKEKSSHNNRKSVETIRKQSEDKTTTDNNTECDKNHALNRCKHTADHHRRIDAIVNILSPEHWTSYGLGKVEDNAENKKTIEQTNQAINETFIKRLQELEVRAPNALEAKLDTYKEWVSVLQRINMELLSDFDDLERTIEERLQAYEASSNFKFRRDVNTLVQFVRQAYHCNNWSLADMKFETMTPAYLMGLDENKPNDMAILNNLLKGEFPYQKELSVCQKKNSTTDMHVKALAEEVAEKHDEINRLKQQLCCLEDEIQNAQKKIQLKDDVIRELRCELKSLKQCIIQDKCNTSFISTNSTSREMAPISTENAKSPRITANDDQQRNASDSLGIAEHLDYLKNQLQQMLSASDWEIDSSKTDAERLRDIFMKLETEKIEALERLKKIRKNVFDILPNDEVDDQNMVLYDNDDLLIRAVRDHIESINFIRNELGDQVQKLLIEKGETAGQIEALNNMNRINCDALKELADLLSSLTNEAFNYEEIYSKSTYNPFCKAICNIKMTFSKTIEDLTAELNAEKEKQRQSKLEIVDVEPSDDGASSTKSGYTRHTSTIPQPNTTSSQNIHSSAPTPRPRQKNKPPDRKK